MCDWLKGLDWISEKRYWRWGNRVQQPMRRYPTEAIWQIRWNRIDLPDAFGYPWMSKWAKSELKWRRLIEATEVVKQNIHPPGHAVHPEIYAPITKWTHSVPVNNHLSEQDNLIYIDLSQKKFTRVPVSSLDLGELHFNHHVYMSTIADYKPLGENKMRFICHILMYLLIGIQLG